MENMIGKTVWVFDPNRRVYAKGPDGRSVGSPLYREHFRPVKVTGETSRSWLVGKGFGQIKVPKTGADIRFAPNGKYPAHMVYMTVQAIEDAVWLKDHAYAISVMVDRCRDVALLRKVAAIIGYDDKAAS